MRICNEIKAAIIFHTKINFNEKKLIFVWKIIVAFILRYIYIYITVDIILNVELSSVWFNVYNYFPFNLTLNDLNYYSIEFRYIA